MQPSDAAAEGDGPRSYQPGQTCGRGNHDFSVEFPRYWKCSRCNATKTKAAYDYVPPVFKGKGGGKPRGSVAWASSDGGWERVLHLGDMAGDGTFEVAADAVVTGRTAIIGASGSGKSYAVGVLAEELLKNRVPFALVDTEGEHAGLRERFEVVLVGDADGSDLRWDRVDLKQLAQEAPDLPPLILDVSHAKDQKAVVAELVAGIYGEVERRRTPYLVIVEEADRFMPQVGERLGIFLEIARRGRKRGLGLAICSQRPSMVDKNVLSQCGGQLIGKLVVQNDLRAVGQFFGGRVPAELTSVGCGTFRALGALLPATGTVRIRERATTPGGYTPVLGAKGPRLAAGPGERADMPAWVRERLALCVLTAEEAARRRADDEPVYSYPCRFRAPPAVEGDPAVSLAEAVVAKNPEDAVAKARDLADERGWALVSVGTGRLVKG